MSPSPRRVYAGQSHEVRVTDRRRAFIDAAIQVIGTRGYRAATVRAICAEAELTDRYFYESFDDAEALLRATYVELSGRLRGKVLAAIEGAEPTMEARTDAGLAAFLEFMRDPRAARIMLMEVLGVSSAVTALYLQNSQEFADLLLGTAKEFVSALPADAKERRLLGAALVGALVYAAGSWALSGYAEPVAAVRRTCRRVLLGTVQQLSGERRG